jgi:aminobenzoyl-glutamate utilization protein B
MKLLLTIACICLATIVGAQSKHFKEINESVEKQKDKMIVLSDKIWSWAELAFEESKSAKALAEYAEVNGFKVERGVAGMPTAFIATYGSGKPVIAILGEYDALPGLSQKATPEKNPLMDGGGGHGCGHNLFGVGSLAAAISTKEWMIKNNIKGTLKFFGTPAEEKYFGKLYLAREGAFEGIDVCLDWHPSATTEANVQSSKALIDFTIEFKGQAAHASADPWNGRSASDGLELFTTGVNFLREHIKPTVRIHYHIMNAGEVVNVVPDYSKIWVRVRDNTRVGVDEVYKKVLRIAEGASLMADVKHEVKIVSGLHEVLVNRVGGEVLHKNMVQLGNIDYTPEETAFAHRIQVATGKKETGIDGKVHPFRATEKEAEGGSTDVGDVSWLVPEIRLGVTTAPEGTPWHSWAVAACGGMSIGHKGMVYAAKALALTMADLYTDPKIIPAVQKEFRERKGDYVYKAILPDAPPPIPKVANE